MVIAFEPHPIRFDYLQRNVELNGLRNVRLVACALGAEEGVANLYDVDPTFGPRPLDVTMTAPIGGRAFQARVRTLDAVLAELGQPTDISLVKIDVEGYEQKVLIGMSKTLSQRPSIVFEALGLASLAATRECLPDGYTIRRLEGHNYLATPVEVL
jgi:FkbM family methyltransferase